MSTNYLQVYEEVLKVTGSDIEAAEAVSAAFDADEQAKAEEEAKGMEAE